MTASQHTNVESAPVSPVAAPPAGAAPAPIARSRAMRRDLAAGIADLHDLAQRHQLTRVQLAKWAARPRHSRMIEDLSRLANTRTLLLIATSRADAALMLRRIALREETDAKEVTRKACVDLIKLDRSLTSTPAPSAAPDAPTERFTAADFDAAMDDFSRRAEMDEQPTAPDLTAQEADEEPGSIGAD